MSEQKKLSDITEKHKKEIDELKKAHEKTLEGLGMQNEGYCCGKCGNRVSLSFPLHAIKKSGLCPSCWWDEDEKVK